MSVDHPISLHEVKNKTWRNCFYYLLHLLTSGKVQILCFYLEVCPVSCSTLGICLDESETKMKKTLCNSHFFYYNKIIHQRKIKKKYLCMLLDISLTKKGNLNWTKDTDDSHYRIVLLSV